MVSNGGNTLTITVPSAQLTTAGTVNVTVTNPSPGGGTTSFQSFAVNNPVPAITTIAPTSAVASGAGFTLTVNGSNFVNGSNVRFNGAAKTTTFVKLYADYSCNSRVGHYDGWNFSRDGS